MQKKESVWPIDEGVNFGDLERRYGNKLFLVTLATIRQGDLRQGEIRDLAEVLADGHESASEVGISFRRLVDNNLPKFAEDKGNIPSAKGVVDKDQNMNLIWRDPTKHKEGTNLEETLAMARMKRISGVKLETDAKDRRTLVGAHRFVMNLLDTVSETDRQSVPWHASSVLVEGDSLVELATQELLDNDPRLLKKAASGMRVASEKAVHRLVHEHLSGDVRRWNEIFGIGSKDDLLMAEKDLTTWVTHLSAALEKTVVSGKGDFELVRGWIVEEMGYWKKMKALEKRVDERLAGK